MFVVVSSPTAGLLTIRISEPTLVERRGEAETRRKREEEGDGEGDEEGDEEEEEEEEAKERHGTQKS